MVREKKLSKWAKLKAKFRNTAQWKKFRAYMYKLSGKKDALTGMPLRKGWQLHHLDMTPENYKDLNPENFCCLNRKSHELIHFLFNYDCDTILKNAKVILQKMKALEAKK